MDALKSNTADDLEEALYGDNNILKVVPKEQEDGGMEFDAIPDAVQQNNTHEDHGSDNGGSRHDYAGWSEAERMAVEMRERNPDITLQESIAKANSIIEARQEGVTITEEGDIQPKDIKDEIKEIEEKLEEYGKNEGLFTDEVRQLVIQHSKLVAIDASKERDRQEAHEREMDAFNAKVDESSSNVARICPDVKNENSRIRQKMSEIYDELASSNSSILHRPDAPEKIFALANMELPENERYEVVKRRSETEQQVQTQKQETQAMQPKQNFGMLPVSGSLRSQATSTVSPAKTAEMIRDANTDTLEQALYGAGTPQHFYIRM